MIQHPFWRVVCEKRNLLRFSAAFTLNLISALFEGLSFVLILAGLTTLYGGEGHYWFQVSAPIAFMAAFGTQICRSVVLYFAQIIMGYLGTDVQTKLQNSVFEQIFRLSFRSISSYKVGDLIDHIQTPQRCTVATINACNNLCVALMMIIVTLGMMALLSFSLTMIVLALFISAAFAQKILLRLISTHANAQTQELVSLSEYSTQKIQGLRVIYSLNLHTIALNKLKKILDKIARATIRINLWSSAIQPLNEGLGILLVGITLFIALFLLNDAALPTLLTFLALTYRLSSRLHMLVGAIGQIAGQQGSLKRIAEILRDDDKEFISTEGKREAHFESTIAFEKVSLRYPSKEFEAVSQLSFTIQRGESVAFVGHSGAGKSSIVDLCLRLYEPTHGSIKVDGQDISAFDLGSWRESIGIVSQDAILFNESIYENIRYGYPLASEEDIFQAAKIAHIHDVIIKLPERYKTVIGERGYRLSGGERQRLALARALVRNPDILILDEATSNLDSFSESEIQKALESLRGKKTMIIVAHRLSTVTQVDRIMVMEKGRMIEEGSHDELLRQKGRYSHFWQLQTATPPRTSLDAV